MADPVYTAEVAALLAGVLLGVVAVGFGGAPVVGVAAELEEVGAFAAVEVEGSAADGSPDAVVAHCAVGFVAEEGDDADDGGGDGHEDAFHVIDLP